MFSRADTPEESNNDMHSVKAMGYNFCPSKKNQADGSSGHTGEVEWEQEAGETHRSQEFLF